MYLTQSWGDTHICQQALTSAEELLHRIEVALSRANHALLVAFWCGCAALWSSCQSS